MKNLDSMSLIGKALGQVFEGTIQSLGFTGGSEKAFSFKNPRDIARIFGLMSNTHSGTSVNQTTSLGYSGYYAPLMIRSRTVMALPKSIMRTTANGPIPSKSHDQHRLYALSPNDYQTSERFWLQFVMNRIHRGNGLAWMDGKDSINGRPTAWHNLNPDYADPCFIDGDLFIKYHGHMSNGQMLSGARHYSEFIHVPNDVCDESYGFQWGIPTHSFGKESIGLGMAAERFTSNFIDKNGHLTRYYKHPEKLDEDDRKILADSLREYAPGQPRSSEIPLFDEDMELIESKMNLAEVDPNTLRKFSIEENARFHNFPSLFKLGHPEKSNYANSYQSGIEFMSTTTIPDVKPILAELNKKCLRPSEYRNQDFYFHMETKGVLEADPEMRSKFLESLYKMGMPLNRILDIENLPGIGKAGDMGNVQVQNIPLDLLSEYWKTMINKATQSTTKEEAQKIIDDAINKS